MVVVIQILSGVLLLHGVFMVRKYVSKNNNVQIRKKNLLVHCGAFGLYLLSLVVLFATEMEYNYNPESKKAIYSIEWGFILCFTASCLS